MHAGARLAQEDVLWFVHADTRPPPDALEHIRQALKQPDVIGGHFPVRFDGCSEEARFLTWFYRFLYH